MWGHSFLILPGFEGRLSLSSLQGENRSFSHTCLRGGGAGRLEMEIASSNLRINEPLLCGRTGGGRWVSISLLSALGMTSVPEHG